MRKLLVYLGVLICSGCIFKPHLTPQEAYFFKQIERLHKEGYREVSLPITTSFEWDKCVWYGPYSYSQDFSALLMIDGTTYDLSQYPDFDVSDDGSWALVFIQNNQIIHIIQGKRLHWFGKHQYLHFKRNNPPEGTYTTNTIIKLNNEFLFTIKGATPGHN